MPVHKQIYECYSVDEQKRQVSCLVFIVNASKRRLNCQSISLNASECAISNGKIKTFSGEWGGAVSLQTQPPLHWRGEPTSQTPSSAPRFWHEAPFQCTVPPRGLKAGDAAGQSINQSIHTYIAPCVASESEARGLVKTSQISKCCFAHLHKIESLHIKGGVK